MNKYDFRLEDHQLDMLLGSMIKSFGKKDREYVNSILDDVLEFYTGYGVTLDFRPGVRLSNKTRSAYIAGKRPLVGRVYPKRKKSFTLYKPFRVSEPIEQRRTVAHEVWHIIERDRKVKSSDTIREGTATYADHLFIGDRLVEDIRNRDDPRFERLGTAKLIQDYMDENDIKNPLLVLLDLETRDKIEDYVIRKAESPELPDDLMKKLRAASLKIYPPMDEK
ncbi:MAG: hypothetical protein ABIA21_01665 [Candidatus Aenigmatarchaeota archaeon]